MPRHPTRAVALAAALAATLAAPPAGAKQIFFAGKGPAPKSTPLPQEGPIPPTVTGRPDPGVGWALRLGCVQGEVGQPVTYQLDGLGIPGTVSYYVDGLGGPYGASSANTLFSDSGVTLDQATGVLSGTPKSAIAGVLTYVVSDGDGQNSGRSSACFQFAPSPNLAASDAIYPRVLPPDGDDPKVVETGEYFELNFSQVYGFYGNISYAIDPKPPKGLTFVNGVLSGQLKDAQEYKFTVKVVDSRGAYGTMPWSVNATYPQPLSPKALDDTCVTGTVGDFVFRTPFAVDVPDGTYAEVSYALTSSPPGLFLSPSRGFLVGGLQPFLDGDDYLEWTKPIDIEVTIATYSGTRTYDMSLCTDIVAQKDADKPTSDNSIRPRKLSVTGSGDMSFKTGDAIKVPAPTTSGFASGEPPLSVFPSPPTGLHFWPDGHMSGALAYPATYTYQIRAGDALGAAVTAPATITVTEKPEGSVVYDGTYVFADQEEFRTVFNPFVVENLPSNARWSLLGDIPSTPAARLDENGKPYPGLKILATTGDIAVDVGFVVRGTPQDDPSRYCACDGGTTVRYYPTVRTTWTDDDGAYREINTTIPVELKIVDFRPTQP